MMEIKAEDILKKFHKIASEYGLKQKNTTKAKVHWKDIELDVNNEKCTIDKKRGIVAWNYKRKNAMQKIT